MISYHNGVFLANKGVYNLAYAMFTCTVKEKMNLGSHMMFVGEVTESKVLGNEPSCTYTHYHKAIRPKF